MGIRNRSVTFASTEEVHG